MEQYAPHVEELARDLVRLDSRGSRSSVEAVECCSAALSGFCLERLDYLDSGGTLKRVLVARRGVGPCLALCGHVDTVPAVDWHTDPWSATVKEGMLHGLGSTDMKGPLAACIIAARLLPKSVPVMLLITADEETTKQGAKVIVKRSELVAEDPPRLILIAEPTQMVPIRGHRASATFEATATGVQAHSATGRGQNANWVLVPFLCEMRALFDRLRQDRELQDVNYNPPYSDFNLVLENQAGALNITVARATARILFRYSAGVDPSATAQKIRAAAARAGVALDEVWDGIPPELPSDHVFVRLCAHTSGKRPRTGPFGTDASQLQCIAPCIVMGPGDMAAAHTPEEAVCLQDLCDAVPVFARIAERVATVDC